MFFHYLLNKEEQSVVNKFLRIQIENSSIDDWMNQVKDDLKILEVEQERIDVKALQYLNCLKAKDSKVLHIQHHSLQL